MNNRITIQVVTRDRHAETGMLLQSLRTQTIQSWDLVLVDDASGTPVANCYFLTALFNRLKLEGHKVKVMRNPVSYGVCFARNKAIEIDLAEFNNRYACRLDDDVILEPDYLEKLLGVINNDYDVASGVVPLLAMPELQRETKYVGAVINEHRIENGELVLNKDECGYAYLDEKIIPTHQFRTNALMKREVQEKVKYPDMLSKVGFREEGWFSLRAQALGYKIGVNTQAIAYHLQCPSGGCRSPNYPADVQNDDQLFRDWIRKETREGKKLLEEYK